MGQIVYDMAYLADDLLDATEDDFEHMADCVRSLGLLVNFLQQSDRMRDGEAAKIAVAIAKGKMTVDAGGRQFQTLLGAHG